MPLVQTRGAASAQGFGEFAQATAVNYIEDVFSTYLWSGNGTSGQTINNGIDLAGKGGLMWMKPRTSTSAYSVYWNRHQLYDTMRGIDQLLSSNTTDAQGTVGNLVTSVTSTGFTIGAAGPLDFASVDYVGWTFRKQPKFFDVVTWTGNDVIGREIPHNLGAVPGCIMVKQTNATRDWVVYHTSIGNTKYLTLNSTSPGGTQSFWNNTTPTSTVFTVGDWGAVNGGGNTYVAYLFASNAGGFGLTGTDNVISCGSFSTPAYAATVNLGFEPQWILYKKATDAGSWEIADSMRGLTVTANDAILYPNTSQAEAATQGPDPTSTGFTVDGYPIGTYIYIAIRRGPMKVPTSGTSVFKPNATSAAAGTVVTTNFPVDLEIGNFLDNYDNKPFTDRLRGSAVSTSSRTGAPFLNSPYTNAETTTGAPFSYNWWNKSVIIGNYISEYRQVSYYFGRAPSFFDVVCYTGTEVSGQTFNHNLGAVPEMMIVKSRSGTTDWTVYHSALGASARIYLNATNAANTGTAAPWNSTTPTSSVFSLGNAGATNLSGATFVNYLFATCAGVSKVGSYTGNGTTQTINCGFGAGGARFVLIKRTDSTSDWYVYDTARGMTVLTDPYLRLNTTQPEVATLGSVTTVSTGFALNSTILAAINVNGGSYIFLAIA